MPQTILLVYQDAAGKAPLRDWLEKLEGTEPKAYARCLERIQRLGRLGYEMRRPAADLLEDGIYELRAKCGRVHDRILYFFAGQNVACLTHGFTKEGRVPELDIENAAHARTNVTTDQDRYTVIWEI